MAGHREDPDREVEQPGGDLAEHGHVELVVAGHEQPVPGDEQHVTQDDDHRPHPRQLALEREQDRRGVDHQPVGERVGDLAELRLHVPAPREEAVDLVGHPRDEEDPAGCPARAVAGADVEHDEQRDQREPEHRERVGELREGCRDGAGGHSRHRIGSARVAESVTLPGFVNAHSHTFQRALRGRAGGGDFWAWRELMLAEAERQTPETVRELYADTYREMRAAGYTAVGEFHYLGLAEARAAADAGAAAGIELVVLLAAYGRGGLERMRQESPADYLRQLEELRVSGRSRRPRPPLRPRLPPRLARGDRTLRGGRGAAAAHPRRRAAARDRGVHRRARLPADRAARAHRLPRAARHRRPRNARGRRRAGPAGRERHDDLRLPDDRGRPRRRLPSGRADRAPRDRALHRLRLERPHRSARGAARARGDRPPPDGKARRLLDGAAALLRRRRGRSLAGARVVAGDRDRPRARLAARRRSGRRLRRAGLELRRRRRRQRAEAPHPEGRAIEVRGLGRTSARAPRPRRSPGSCAGAARAGSICVPSCHSL